MAENRKKEDIALLLNGLFNKITEKEEFVDKIIYNIMTEAVAKIDDNSDLNYSISFNIPVTVKILNNEPKIKNNNDLKSDDICALIQILGKIFMTVIPKMLKLLKNLKIQRRSQQIRGWNYGINIIRVIIRLNV